MFTPGSEESAGPSVDWQAEVTLAPEITGVGKPPANLQRAPNIVFLTGGTGFLGAYLLKALRAHFPAAEICCLVRADSELAARERLRSNLLKFKLDADSIMRSVRPVLGDLAQPNLGLSTSEFARLAAEVDWIYHNGAAVNFIYPYAALRMANVEGTRHVLRLATETRLKPIHFSSTLAVLLGDQIQSGLIRESDEFEYPERMTSGYGQSKWVAERLVRLAATRGVPVAIYRPGRITGDSLTGSWNSDDLFLVGLNMLLQLGAAPDVDVQLDLTPVDYVAEAMVAISSKPESVGRTFHLVNENLVGWMELVKALQREGFPLKVLNLTDWRREFAATYGELPDDWISWLIPVDERTRTGADAADGQMADDSRPLSAPRIRYDCGEVQRCLAGSSIDCPAPDEQLLRTYIRGLIDQELLPNPAGGKAD
jgi:thioester reductase-like protein